MAEFIMDIKNGDKSLHIEVRSVFMTLDELDIIAELKAMGIKGIPNKRKR